ncbi:MAG: DUF4215 domain-containing protein [Deltaproteobacteria bacterium]|jgi:cysteine-rich repeat protein|nr:DUF4215 domain-containing protein [Deltaproteobacteria bacterium]
MNTFYKFFLTLILISFTGFITACDDESKENLCGNGIIDFGEQCDPAMEKYANNPYCTDDCKITQFCGNGLIEGTEECDDGNLANDDGCSRNCLVEIGCGNGLIDLSLNENGYVVIEECDDDNINSGDGCDSDCMLEGQQTCGNGVLEYPEECDDGNTEDGDGCSTDCEVTDGCGDGHFDPLTEECDDGNTLSSDGCNGNCQIEFNCGNGDCDEEQGENCQFCPSDCCPECGDEILDDGEECDDGNNEFFDGCSAGCMDEDSVATCGNSIWEVGEECEDGNKVNGDGCDSECLREFIVGDGECEINKGETCRLSTSDCCPDCGDNTVNGFEKCDTSNLDGLSCTDLCYDGGTLNCTDWCEFDFSGCTGTGPVCGDGTAECEEECDGSDFKAKTCNSFGFEEGNLICDSNCNIDSSNCSGFLHYILEDFEGGSTPSGWTINGNWELGSPGSDGPSSAYSGSIVLSSSLNGNYLNDMDFNTNNVQLPSIDLTTSNAPIMTFYSWLDSENSYDGGRIEVSTDGGSTWNFVLNSEINPGYDDTTDNIWCGSYNSWSMYTVDLSSYIGNVVEIRFAFHSDSSVSSYAGWYIDDLLITEDN